MYRFSFVFLIALLLASCSTQKDREYIRLSGFTQGTTYSIIYYDSLGRNLSEPINEILQKVDSSMSLYRENSIINAFNASSSGIQVDSLLADVVRLSIQYSIETNGAFDITVGPLVRAWGFHASQDKVPDDATINQLLSITGVDNISLSGNFLSKKHPGVIIDVNAIAQGYTVDIIALCLDNHGVKDYLVELGGEIRTHGKSPRNDLWLVGVDKPEDHALSGENLQVIIKLSGESLVTSGSYRKFFEKDGVKYSHTIDPTTGYPVTHSLLSATVIDKTSARADALATAFMVMGVKATQQWLLNNPEVDAYLIYSDEHGEFQVWMSDGMNGRLAKE